MTRQQSGIRRVLRLRQFTAESALSETDEEVRMHIELRAAELMAAGWDEAAAVAEARRLFARDENTLRDLYAAARERNRHMRFGAWLETLFQDVRYAARSLVRDPAASAFVIATLTLGIGANITTWSLVDRLLLRDPAHVVDADRVLRLFAETESEAFGRQASPWIPYSAYRQFGELSSFESVAAYRVLEGWVGEAVEGRRMRVAEVLGPLFPLLGVSPHRGRLFSATEDAATSGDLAVLSHELWRSGYGGDLDIIGRSISVAGVPRTIVGVAPPGFNGLETRRVAVWTLASGATAGNRNWWLVGRLRPGVTADAASAEATSRHVPDETGPFAWFRDARIFAAPWSWDDTGRASIESTLARWLAGVTAVILLIALASVVNVLLVRLARRRRELAIRASLGAGRGRVIRLIALEGALLALASGAASLFVARALQPGLQRSLFGDELAWHVGPGDPRLLGLALAILLLTTICIGIPPALQAGSAHVADALRTGRHVNAGNVRMRSALSIMQAAFSVLLLVGAGLFLRSVVKVRALDLGIERDRVLVVDATLPSWRSFGEGTFSSFADMERTVYRRLEARLRQMAGVENVAIAVGLPLDGGSFSAPVTAAGRDSVAALPGGGPYVSSVSADYFTTIGTSLIRGRAFSETDREGSERVVIINETMARTLWPDRTPLGECVRVGNPVPPCYRVVGVAADVHRTGLQAQPSFQLYIPLGQQTMFGGARLVVRPDHAAPPSADLLRRAITEAEPATLSVEVRRLDAAIAGELRPLRIGVVTFGVSSALALIVAVMGLYGLMAYMVAGRTHEIGVRMALGASRASVVKLVLRSGLMLAAIGIAVGLAIAAWAGKWLQPHLFQTSARDTVVMAVVAAILLATALGAGWVPTRRALRISPTEALRAE